VVRRPTRTKPGLRLPAGSQADLLARPLRWGAALAATAALSLAACTGPGDPAPTPSDPAVTAAPSASGTADLTAFYNQTPTWEDCGKGLRCTTVKVPADYSDPAAGSVELAVVRRAAKDSRGALVVNPGGPGGSGIDYARAPAELIVGEKVAAAYDIVGFDPRGVGSSSPVRCVEDATMDALYAADPTPDDQAEIDQLVTRSAAIGKGCARAGGIAGQVDTVSAARDMDVLRAALREDRLNFLGKSYGSTLGARYAEEFPDRVGRFVLDGILPADLSSEEIAHGQAVGFEDALRQFVTWCISDADCPLPRDVDQGLARIRALLADLETEPLPGLGNTVLNEGLGALSIVYLLYQPPTDWVSLEFGLGAALDGDGSALLDMLDDRLDRTSDGRYTSNLNDAFFAVSCLDRPATGGAERAAELAEEWAKDAPTFGRSFAWGGLTCDEWPLGSVAPAGQDPMDLEPVQAQGAAPILVVSTLHDPATPYQWGVKVADDLASGHLLTFAGDGHTAYSSGSDCIDQAVDAYLLDGTLPAAGTSCPSITAEYADLIS
jgi:pimeloyl-ACP methyl ester carboxylesterase